MMDWNNIEIKAVYDYLFDGPHATPMPSSTGPVFLGIKNISEDGKFDFTDTRHISEKEYPKWTKRVVPAEGDIVFSYEATLHRYAIIPKDFKGCLGRRMALIRMDSKRSNNKFLYYYFFTKKWREEVNRHLIKGATVDRIPLTKFPEFKVEIPQLTIQKQISSIISAYDDLIENNQKRIKTLEEMAQRLYTEWFVKFKFPGHENVKMVDSGTEFAKIPNGWEVKELNEVVDIIRGKSYSSSEIDSEHGKYYLVNLKSFNRGGGFRFDGEKYFNGNVNSNQLLLAGDIVIAVTDMTTDRAVIARPAMIPKINHDQVTMSADVVKVESKLLSKMFLYFLLLDENFTATTKAKANGANVLHLKPNLIGEYSFVLPPADLIEKFDEIMGKHAFLIDILNNRNVQLSKMRDLLIENLVTGKRKLNN